MTDEEKFRAEAYEQYKSRMEDLRKHQEEYEEEEFDEESDPEPDETTNAGLSDEEYEQLHDAWEERKEKWEAEQDSKREAFEDERDSARDVLAIEKRTEIHIQLSWGGPADGFYLYFDKEDDLVEGFYYFQDWFKDKARFYLSNSEMDMVAQFYGIDDPDVFG